MNNAILAEVHEDNEALFRALIEKALEQGYQLISGLFDCNSIYQIVALCKHPDLWEPYKAYRCFESAEAMALWWYYTSLNPESTIYEKCCEEDLEEGEEPLEVNAEKWQLLEIGRALDDFEVLPVEKQETVLERIREVVENRVTERWDAPRSD